MFVGCVSPALDVKKKGIEDKAAAEHFSFFLLPQGRGAWRLWGREASLNRPVRAAFFLLKQLMVFLCIWPS